MAKILVATDGSELAIRAGQHAMELLGSSHDYTMLTVVPPPVVIGAAGEGTMMGVLAANPVMVQEQTDAAEAEAEATMTRTMAALGIEHAASRIERGDPGTVICRVAEEERFHLVTIGSHGAGVVRRMLLGSVSHHVLHHAPCPVMVLRDRDRKHG